MPPTTLGHVQDLDWPPHSDSDPPPDPNIWTSGILSTHSLWSFRPCRVRPPRRDVLEWDGHSAVSCPAPEHGRLTSYQPVTVVRVRERDRARCGMPVQKRLIRALNFDVILGQHIPRSQAVSLGVDCAVCGPREVSVMVRTSSCAGTEQPVIAWRPAQKTG